MAPEAKAMLCPSDLHSDQEIVNFAKKYSGEDSLSIEKNVDLGQGGANTQLFGATCGNAGCDYYIFVQYKLGTYAYRGHAFFHKDAFKILRESGDSFGILAYVRENAERGKLVRYRSAACEMDTLTQIDGTNALWDFVKTFPQPAD